MASRKTITPDTPFTLENDVVYAVPARSFNCYAPNGDKLEFSNDATNWTASAGSAIPYNGIVACGFIRSHGGDQIITLSRM